MNIKKAKEICEEYGWEISEGKYHLKCSNDEVTFSTDKELIGYAEDLDKTREGEVEE